MEATEEMNIFEFAKAQRKYWEEKKETCSIFQNVPLFNSPGTGSNELCFKLFLETVNINYF